jgi:hypothetical protein
MNERIRKLVGDATLYADSHWDRGCAPWHQFYNEKFAELIVGECYLWAKENGGLGCEEDFEALKEHFGVEQ